MLFKHLKPSFSTLKSPCLVREFIYDRLYNPQKGYFCQPNIQIGELQTHIDFKSMIGYDDYKSFLFKNYPENAWLTPSELFKPWYGFTIANYIHKVIKKMKLDPKKQRIRVVEVGAGTGAALDAVLFFFKNYEQALYNILEFNVVEISPQMCQRATEKFKKHHLKLLDKGQLKILNDDFLNFKVAPNSKDFTFVIFLEVLDNMPHDKAVFCDKSQDWKFQTMVDLSAAKPKEILVPISDPLIAEVLGYYKDFAKDNLNNEMKKNFWEKMITWQFSKKQPKSLFLPTYCLKMLRFVRDTLPNHHLIISDFDLLPRDRNNLNGIYAPIVSKKLRLSHEKKDFDSYLVEPGEADIFFPTDFELLKKIYKGVCKKKAVTLKTHEFVSEFAKEKWGETRSGYNPLKEDFLNTAFFVTDI